MHLKLAKKKVKMRVMIKGMKKQKKSSLTPRPYLSYSSYKLFKTNQRAWVRYYIYGEKNLGNKYTNLGTEIHDAIDGNDSFDSPILKKIVRRYRRHKSEVRGDLMGIPLLVRPDGISYGKTIKCGEYKTGLKFASARKAASDQLKWTEVVLRANFKGKVPPIELTGYWIETKEIKNRLTYTGLVKPFSVKLGKIEKTMLIADIVKTWSEIKKVCAKEYSI